MVMKIVNQRVIRLRISERGNDIEVVETVAIDDNGQKWRYYSDHEKVSYIVHGKRCYTYVPGVPYGYEEIHD